jgi:hypothetical protein
MSVTDRTTATSRALNPKTLDYERDATGRLRKRHWVDNAVWTLLRTRKGSVRSAPDVGNSVPELRYIDEKTTPADVVDRVSVALANLITRQLVRIDRVQVDLGATGAILYQVDYTNLVTAQPGRVPLPLSQAA